MVVMPQSMEVLIQFNKQVVLEIGLQTIATNCVKMMQDVKHLMYMRIIHQFQSVVYIEMESVRLLVRQTLKCMPNQISMKNHLLPQANVLI